MCELFGFSSRRKQDITEYLEAFFSHCNTNPHGWGIAYDNGTQRVKEPVKATESTLLPEVVKGLHGQTNVLAHIRYATVGKIRQENCHPFSQADISGRQWTMIHNGTIYSGRDTYKYIKKQIGDTDSERLFLSFMDTMNERLSKGGVCERERFEIVNDFVTENAPRNKLNLMFFDGELLYAHKNMKNTLSIKRENDTVVISTSPLDGGEWIPFPMAQLIAFKDGKPLYKGTKHKGIFVPNLEYITALDAMNI